MGEPIFNEIFRCKKDSGTFPPNSPYKANLMSALKKLENGFNFTLVGNHPNAVQVAKLCAGYINPIDCASCVKNTIPLLLQKCPNQKGAVAWRVKCMVRYGPPVPNNYDLWFVAHEVSDLKAKDVVGLEKTLSELIKMLLIDLHVANRSQYAYKTLVYGPASQTQHVYMVMQCTRDTLHEDCHKCLGQIFKEMKPCCSGAIAAAMLSPNCYLRYAHSDFRVL